MADVITTSPGRRIRWNNETILGLFYVAETALVWMIVASLFAISGDNRTFVSPWLILGLIAASSLIPRLLEELNVWDPWYQIVLSVAIAITGLIAVKSLSFPESPWFGGDWFRAALDGLIFRSSSAQEPVWASVLVVAIIWWRGRTREAPSVDVSFRFLRAGVVVTLIGEALFTLSSQRTDQPDSATAVMVFFTSAIAAIGLCRAVSADQLGYQRLSARSLSTALVPALIAAAGSVVLAGIFTRDVVDTVYWALGPLLWVLGIALQAVVLAIAVIVLILLSPFIFLLQGRTPDFQGIRVNSSNPFADTTGQDPTSQFDLVPDPIRYILAAVILVLLFGGITKFVLRRRGKSVDSAEDADRETLRPVFDFRALLASLLRKIGLGSRDEEEDPLSALRGKPGFGWTIEIRETYARFLRSSQAQGLPRQASTTPIELGIAYGDRFGHRVDQPVLELTQLYDRARYGAAPSTQDDAQRVASAWEEIQRSMKTET